MFDVPFSTNKTTIYRIAQTRQTVHQPPNNPQMTRKIPPRLSSRKVKGARSLQRVFCNESISWKAVERSCVTIVGAGRQGRAVINFSRKKNSLYTRIQHLFGPCSAARRSPSRDWTSAVLKSQQRSVGLVPHVMLGLGLGLELTPHVIPCPI